MEATVIGVWLWAVKAMAWAGCNDSLEEGTDGWGTGRRQAAGRMEAPLTACLLHCVLALLSVLQAQDQLLMERRGRWSGSCLVVCTHVWKECAAGCCDAESACAFACVHETRMKVIHCASNVRDAPCHFYHAPCIEGDPKLSTHVVASNEPVLLLWDVLRHLSIVLMAWKVFGCRTLGITQGGVCPLQKPHVCQPHHFGWGLGGIGSLTSARA